MVFAWKSRKSWTLVVSEERVIHPDLMRMMAKCAGCEPVEVKTRPAVFMSERFTIADPTRKAANNHPD